VLVDRRGLQSGSVFQRPLNFVPAAVVDGDNTLAPGAECRVDPAAGQWAFSAATNTIFVRMLANTNPLGGVRSSPRWTAHRSRTFRTMIRGGAG
jgi:hypothetical protein